MKKETIINLCVFGMVIMLVVLGVYGYMLERKYNECVVKYNNLTEPEDYWYVGDIDNETSW
jgi:hypothetical protein